MKKFEPWNMLDYDKPLMSLDIKEPPCKNCRPWSPRAKTTSLGDFDGVILCLAGDQEFDFSCFRGREG